MNRDDFVNLSRLAFLLGILLALMSGFINPLVGWDLRVGLSIIMIVLGVIVGQFTIRREQRVNFLIAIMTLLLSTTAALTAFPGGIDVVPFFAMRVTLINLGLLIAPAAVTVAIKIVFDLIARE